MNETNTVQQWWRSRVLTQLKRRNVVIAKCIELELIVKNQKTFNAQLQQEKASLLQDKLNLQSRVDDLEEKVKAGLVNAQAREREDALQQEINKCLKENAAATRSLLEMHEQLREKEERLQATGLKMEALNLSLATLQKEASRQDELLTEKDETIETLKAELQQLQVLLVRTEEAVQQLKRENKAYEKRVNKKLEEDVLKMNEAQKYFQSPSTTNVEVSPITPTLSASCVVGGGGVLDSSISKPIGASTVPRSLKKTFQIHTGEVNSVAYSQTGSLFVTGGSDRTVKVWDSYSLTSKHTLTGPERAVMQVAFSPNDECVMAASNDNACRVWALNMGRVRHCLMGHLAKVHSAQFSYDNEKIVTGSHDKTLRVWDLVKRFCPKTMFCFSACNDLCLSRDSTQMYTGHLDHQVRVWDVKNGDCTKELANLHNGQITSVCLSPDGLSLLTSSRDNLLKLVDLRMFEVIQTYSHEAYKNSLNWTRSCFSPDGRYVASGSGDGLVFVWNVNTTTVEQMLRGHKTTVTQVAWNPTGFQVASVDRSGTVNIWG